MRTRGIIPAFSFLLLTTVPTWAADYVAPVDLCAVSAVNGKLHGQGGVYDF